MQRYFIPSQQMSESTCVITGQDAHHIGKVMRSQPGDQVICSDGQGRTVIAEIVEIDQHEVRCTVHRQLTQTSELPIQVTIAQGLPKGDKFEWIIQKGTELGAASFLPFSSARTIVKYDKKKEQKKRERWNKIAKEAAEQAHRDRIPEVQAVVSFEQLLNYQVEHKWVAYEKVAAIHSAYDQTERSSLFKALQKVQPGEHILVIIGPEGGITEEEINRLEEAEYFPVSLGKRILRTETASQYVLASISLYFEQMGG